jgi:aryl-alcohol dehydrogenase-like predicted oxidoreductase
MKLRPLGDTGVRLSAIGLGALPFGTDLDETASAAMLDRCLDAGVNHVDCADIYGGGRAEAMLGTLLPGRRDRLVLASKVSFPTGRGANDGGSSRLHLTRAVEASLRRLGTDRIDVLYLHRFDARAALDDQLRALDDLVRAGKIVYPAASNFAAWQVAKALGRCELRGWARFAAIQPMYNLLKRQAEVELFPMAASEGVGVVCYGPLAGGVLSGKYVQAGTTGRFVEDPMYVARYRGIDAHEVAASLAALAAESGHHPATLAVAWAASHPSVTSILVGGRSLDQLEPSLAAANADLGPDLLAAVGALTPQPPPANDRNEERR